MNEFQLKALKWAQQFKYVAWLHHNHISYPCESFINCLAVSDSAINFNGNEILNQLKNQIEPRWLFGYLGYDLVEELEDINCNNPKTIDAPKSIFFEPTHLILFEKEKIKIISNNKNTVLAEINSLDLSLASSQLFHTLNLQCSITKSEYLANVGHIIEQIQKGDIYEINYSIEFSAVNYILDPLSTYLDLNTLSPTPFSSYLKLDKLYILGASPERFIKKEGDKIISQPIKGTKRRGKTPVEDAQNITDLTNSPKERSENIMIVDLVRNDLSKTCKPGTVKVQELCGIYTFKQVHQMISTVVAQCEDVPIVDIIKNAFPMGSMTGAPKVSAMNLIQQFENHHRGIYSGAIGYFTPEQDFDFNVVIRSLVYDQLNQKLSFCVGSAITALSNPEEEYTECLLKAKAIFEVLGIENNKIP